MVDCPGKLKRFISVTTDADRARRLTNRQRPACTSTNERAFHHDGGRTRLSVKALRILRLPHPICGDADHSAWRDLELAKVPEDGEFFAPVEGTAEAAQYHLDLIDGDLLRTCQHVESGQRELWTCLQPRANARKVLGSMEGV